MHTLARGPTILKYEYQQSRYTYLLRNPHNLHDILPSYPSLFTPVLGDGILGKRDVLRMRATLRLTLLYGLPHIHEEFRDGIGPSNGSGENPPPVTIHTRFERFNKQNPHSFDNAAAPKDAENRISQLEEILMFSRQGIAQFPDVAHNLEILQDQEDCDESERSGKNLQPIGNTILSIETVNKNAVMDATEEQESAVQSGECRHAARNCFKRGQTGHLQQDGKKDTTASTSGHADKETRYIRPCLPPLANFAESDPLLYSVPSIHVAFLSIHGSAVISDSGCVSRKTFQGISFIRDVEYDIGLRSGAMAYCRKLLIVSTIKTAQKDDGEIWAIIQNIDQQTEFRVDDDGILWQGTKLCVPEDPTLREALMTEAHSSPFSIHPGSTKMYHDLKQHFWWSGMKRDVATFVSKCLTCQQVKIEHQRASGLLQPLEIPVWKWDEISMDFVTGLPRTQRKHDAIWVVVDRLTKSAHFLPIRKDYPVSKLAEMFQQEIVRLHGTPSAIVSDRDPRFTSRFWKGLQKAWGTRLKFSTAFHPETDGQSERTIQTLEDMLRSCALEWAGNWDDYICLVEFAYNNSWHASIKCAPFEMLYGRKCRAPICWDQVGERILEGPEMIEVTNEKVAVAREKLKEAQTRQKSYADRHRRALEFQPGEHVFLKVSPTRGVRRFGIKGKLSPRFIGPFEILDRVGEVSYRLALPPQLSHVHNVFHVSLLRGYKYHPLHVISYPFDQIREDLSYTEEPESILDRQDRVMRNKTIPFVKILWRNHPEREATWETEESIRTSYPHFLP
ncbi:putative nucleotidyltransferase, ribonuclease H [Tanacetum coccineum]|uniref:Nucleotidyltransferase, ribonuclease H n=1 Tax=Tanacetum coccineum TaxID=301880 RepID=A0ABQ5A4L3_9ASTR